MSEPINISSEAFDNVIQKSSEKPVLVDFWAEWCGPCKMIAPSLKKIAGEKADDLIVGKFDIDANEDHQRKAMEYNVMSIPTLILFKDGQEVERMVGALPKPAIDAKLQPHLA